MILHRRGVSQSAFERDKLMREYTPQRKVFKELKRSGSVLLVAMLASRAQRSCCSHPGAHHAGRSHLPKCFHLHIYHGARRGRSTEGSICSGCAWTGNRALWSCGMCSHEHGLGCCAEHLAGADSERLCLLYDAYHPYCVDGAVRTAGERTNRMRTLIHLAPCPDLTLSV